MLKKAVPNLKRWVSGYLVAVMTLMLVFNNSFAFSALAAETASGSNAEKEASASDAFKNSKVSLKNSQKEDVQFLIFSEQSSYEPGETVCLDLYIKNNTDKTITDGLLKIARAKGIEEDSAYFEDMTDLYEAANREEEKPEETTAEETKAEETEEGTSAEEKEELTAESSEEIGSESAETPEITEAAESVEDLLPTESEPEMRGDENIGMEIAGNEEEETVEEGSAAVEDETSKEDEEETDEEEKEEPDRLSELEILPGKTAYINFYYTIDPEIEGMKDQDIKFSFDWTQENKDGKEEKHNKKEEFCYSVDALNLLTVTTGGEKGWIEVGKEDEMLLEFDLGQMREILDEAVEEELEKHEDDDASASEARRASASETLVGWDDENGSRPLGKKDPAVIKKLKCEVETFGLKLNKFKAAPVTDDDNYGTSLKCDFLVSRNNVPGTYYGRVKASYEIKNRTFHTTQAFKVVVKQETGEIELTGKIGDSEIIMSGPASSFPRAEELSLKVSEVTQEQQEKVDEALQKKAEEEETEIKQYKALDIKLIADGKETEPEGDVQVRFKNIELENPEEKKDAEQEKAEEQSIVKKAVNKVMSLFGLRDEEEDVAAVAETEVEAESKDSEDGKAEGSEDVARETTENNENIKVLHLDEDAVVANEMKSEVKENGDVVMDTDHFSIYIVVNVPGVTSVTVEVHHYADIEYWELEDTNKAKVEMSWDSTSEEWKYYYVDINGNKTTEVPSDVKLRLTEVTTKDERETLLPTEDVTVGRYTFKDHVLYPGAANPKNSSNRYRKLERTEIYSSNTYEVPNGAGTGITYTLAVDKWSKVSSAGRYEVKKIIVTNEEVSENEEDEELKELRTGKTIENVKVNGKDPEVKLAAGKNVIDIYYEPTKGNKMGPVYFHDYNVGIEKDSSGAVNTKEVGMNNPVLPQKNDNDQERKVTNRIGIGISNPNDDDRDNNIPTDNQINNYLPHHVSGNDYLFSYKNNGLYDSNARNQVPRYGIPAETIQNGQFNVNETKINVDPGLFVPNDIITKEIYRGKTTPENYYAKEYIDDLQLKFSRNGDNYILTAICDKNNNVKLGDLNRLVYSGDNWNTTNPMFTNLFWPLDDDTLFNGVPGKTRDHKYGDKKHGINSQNDEVDLVRTKMNNNAIEIPHNWFFGMNCQLKFKVGDYIGPMNYYFRGDDDFWLYVDGVLVKDVDLGGTHKAVPAYVDLRKWMKSNDAINGGISQDPNTEHTMSIFFMERGGTGSCCYMAFTLPNAEIVPLTNPKADFVDVTVTKNWLDNENALFLRPGSLNVELYQEGKDENGATITKKFAETTLSESNGWTHTWTGFPKYCWVNSEKEEFKYYAREVTNEKPEKYDDHYYNSSNINTEITNVLKVNIPVKKKWVGDEDKNIRPDEIYVKLWKSKNNSIESNSEETIFSQSISTENGAPEDTIIEDESDEGSLDAPENETNPDDQKNFIVLNKTDPNWKNNWEQVGSQIILSNTNSWKDTTTWVNLPLYEKDESGAWKEIIYAIEEVDMGQLTPTKAEGWYEATYEGDIINGFTITNTFKDELSVDIPISKQCINFDGEADFNFKVEEVSLASDGTWNLKPNSSSQTTSIHVSNGTGSGKFSITYKVKDIANEISQSDDSKIERWYKISEENGAGNFIYDNSFYIIKIELRKKTDGTYVAEWNPNPVYKNGIQLDKDVELLFVNYKKVDLQISKVVVGNNPNGKTFEFTATIEKNGKKFGSIDFSVEANNTTPVSISVPVGSVVTIQEKKESHAGYYVTYQIDSTVKSELLEEDKIKIEIPNDNSVTQVGVTCTNTTSARLPDTGGPGLLMMSRLGWMLLLLALLMAGMEIQFYGERRNRKTANVQREDTRGFDPDDY